MHILENIFLSKTRASIFESLFSHETKEYYLRELERHTGIGLKSLQVEIRRMLSMDLLIERKDGNRRYFKANTSHPLYDDFKSIVNKVCGPELLLRELLYDHKDVVEYAFIFGSFAKGDTHAESDIDLFVIGDIKPRQLSDLLWEVQKKISYEVNEHVYSIKVFKKEIKIKKHFLLSLKNTKKIFLKGTEVEFKQLFK